MTDHTRSGDWWKDIPDRRPDVRKEAEQWPCDDCGAAQGDPCMQDVTRSMGYYEKPVTVRVKRKMPCLSRLKKVEGPKLL